jgi:hypothetical protein
MMGLGKGELIMPTGVYKRTRKHLKGLAAGRMPEARAKAAATLKRLAARPGWKAMVGDLTRERMADPEIRKRHLAGLVLARARHGTNFKGGNGQPPTETVRAVAERLIPKGFIRELAIPTRGHGAGLRPPTSYKADFAHPQRKMVLELDGPCHRLRGAREKEIKKTTVLRALGWTVKRIKHK